MSTLAIDVDLGRFTAVHSTAGVLAHGHPWDGPWPTGLGSFATMYQTDVLLLEVAGPIMHHEESHSWRRWAIFNALWIGQLIGSLPESSSFSSGHNILVATSTAWTKGFGEKERHAIAGMNPLKFKTVKGKKVPIYAEAHDIRECRAMLYFHERDPKTWKTLDEYLKELVG